MFSISRIVGPAVCVAVLALNGRAEDAKVVSGQPTEVLEYLDSVKGAPEVPYEVAQAAGVKKAADLPPAPATAGEQVLEFNLKAKPQGEKDVFQQEVFNQLVSLDFKNADIQNVVRLVARRTGLNILLDPSEVSGTITLSLENVRLGHALDNILKVNKLAYVIESGDIVRIVPESRVGRGEVETTTEVIELNWRNAEDVAKTFEKFLTPHGSMKANDESQSLIITDVPPNIEKLKALIKQIDHGDRQVKIEARLVDLQVEAAKNFTTSWSMAKLNNDAGALLNGATGAAGAVKAVTDLATSADGVPLSTVGGVMPVLVEGVGVNGGQGTFQFGSVIGIFGDEYNLNATLTALEERHVAQVLASPRVTTLNNVPASINIIRRIPYVTQSLSAGGGVSAEVKFEDAGVKIKVKPIITPSGYIRLDMNLDQTIFRGRVGSHPLDPPLIDVRKSDSTVIVKSKNTVVLGGLRGQESQERIQGVPWLYRIPLIGWAFKDKSDGRLKTDLVLMVTPDMVEEALINDVEKEQYDRIDTEWHLPDYFNDDVETQDDKSHNEEVSKH